WPAKPASTLSCKPARLSLDASRARRVPRRTVVKEIDPFAILRRKGVLSCVPRCFHGAFGKVGCCFQRSAVLTRIWESDTLGMVPSPMPPVDQHLQPHEDGGGEGKSSHRAPGGGSEQSRVKQRRQRRHEQDGALQENAQQRGRQQAAAPAGRGKERA